LDPEKQTEWFGKAESVKVNSLTEMVELIGNAHLKQWQDGEVTQEIMAEKILVNRRSGEVFLEGDKTSPKGTKRRVMLSTLEGGARSSEQGQKTDKKIGKTGTNGLTKARLRDSF
jgi:lipopolysaccharide export system protein LptA